MLRVPDTNRPIRVLHALGSLNRGGIETWLMQFLPRVDRNRLQMDFLVHSDGGEYESEVRSQGCGVLRLRPTGLRRPLSYFQYPRDLKRLFRDNPYDIVHAHMQEFSGYILRAAAHAGVTARIAHSQ